MSERFRIKINVHNEDDREGAGLGIPAMKGKTLRAKKPRSRRRAFGTEIAIVGVAVVGALIAIAVTPALDVDQSPSKEKVAEETVAEEQVAEDKLAEEKLAEETAEEPKLAGETAEEEPSAEKQVASTSEPVQETPVPVEPATSAESETPSTATETVTPSEAPENTKASEPAESVTELVESRTADESAASLSEQASDTDAEPETDAVVSEVADQAKSQLATASAIEGEQSEIAAETAETAEASPSPTEPESASLTESDEPVTESAAEKMAALGESNGAAAVEEEADTATDTATMSEAPEPSPVPSATARVARSTILEQATPTIKPVPRGQPRVSDDALTVAAGPTSTEPSSDEPMATPIVAADPTETDAAPTEKSEVTVSQLQATKAPLRRPTVATLEHVSTNSGGGVARAYLTSGLRNREPVDKLTSSTGFPSEQGREFFYFTELLGLTGKTVTHRWEHNGRFEGDISFSVRGNRWRVYSSKTITPLQTGTWKVVVSTEEGKVLADTEFVIQRQ
ncbi:MAG: DUF2914 domain-containing protein [Rhodospirillales bacterium]|nr:DUF2914 domain-containing protein [Rhodospirillales bacterium]